MPVAIAVQSTFLINDNKTLEQAQAELDATSGDTPSNSETPTTPVVEPPVEPSTPTQTSTPTPADEVQVPTAPTVAVPRIVAAHDSLKISTDTGSAYHGNLLENDSAINGTVLLRRFGDSAVDKHGLTLTGKYGVIHVESDGDYTYTVDAVKIAGFSGKVSESFQYKISDGASHIDTDSLGVYINVDAFHSSQASHLLV